MLNPSRIRAISLDLDDTLWPVWPAIHRAEARLVEWLQAHAPATAARFSTPQALRSLREQVEREHPELHLDLGAMRRESIRLALLQSGDDPALAEPAFAYFFAQRQVVDLYEDALPALEFLAERWPIVAVTNGNADVHTVGIGRFFQHSFNVMGTGFAKPDARMFHTAAAALALPAEQVLHIGDDAHLDAVGARAAGMQAVWLNREGRDWPVAGETAPMTVPSLNALCAALQT